MSDPATMAMAVLVLVIDGNGQFLAYNYNSFEPNDDGSGEFYGVQIKLGELIPNHIWCVFLLNDADHSRGDRFYSFERRMISSSRHVGRDVALASPDM